MNNLYVFAIGGSGERVMYSLVMALGAGMTIAANRIVPIFVDNDKRSPALDRATNLIKYYRNIPNGGNDPKCGARELVKLMENNKTTFFSTEIDEPISLVIGGDNITTLGEQTSTSIKINDLEKRINEEKNLLFTQDELSMPLSAGFIGHPNIGSVILNSWEFNQESYINLVNNIGENDGVLVIGSLFGGTGAAGIPLIINKFNESPQRPKIGVVAVLPYFKTEKSKDGDGGKWVVNTDEFDIKTRAALMYYDKYMRNLDYLYYVGDGNHLATYKYSIGGDGTGIVGKEPQKNPTHPIEVMAAMSVFDFAQSENTNSVQYKIPVWKYGKDENRSNKSNLTDIQLPQFRHALVKFQMLKNLFVSDILKECINHNTPFVKDINIEIPDINDVTTDINGKKEPKKHEYWGINMFIKEWYKWVAELEHRDKKNANKREMNYFDQNTTASEDNFTTLFYTDQEGCGVAKKETRKGWFKIGIRSEEVVMKSEVKNYLQASFDELSKEPGIINKVKQSNKMSFLLWVISSGLDRMINEKCFV